MKQTIIIIIVLVVVVGGVLLINHAFHSTPKPADSTAANNANQSSAQSSASTAGLQSQDIAAGTGPAAKAGDQLTVTYTGTLTDGTVFDSNVGKTPFVFTIGNGQVIQGWDEGLIGMKAGGERKLTIPPALGYGDQATGSIPPNSTLIFDVKLTKIN